MSTTDEATHLTIDAIDEALRWATAGGVRVWEFIDRRLDERLEVAGRA